MADVAAAARALIDSNYQAWHVLNSAQGKGGSGGSIEALGDLLRNGVSLAGIKLDDAWLGDVQLPNATLPRSSLRRANLARANLSGATLEGADLRDADLVAANLSGAYLKGADLTGHTSIDGVRHAPAGFLEFARQQGAVDAVTRAIPEDELDSNSRQFRAI